MLKKSVSTVTRNYGKQMPKFDFVPPKYEGPSYEDLMKIRKEHMNPALLLSYKKPIMLTHGKMQYLYDQNGKRYADFLGGIVTISIGHCHDRLVKVAQKQLENLMHATTLYLHPEVTLYAKELSDKLPGNLNQVYFVNSGSEATDLAMLLARLATGNTEIIALKNAYHGMSNGAMGLTSFSTWKYPVPQGHHVQRVTCPDLYKGPWRREDANALDKYVEQIKDTILCSTSGNVAGFIAETVQGVGGTIEMPEGYLPRVYEMVRKAGGVCIADEVQTGFARTGTHYWGFETQGVIPDIVTMAKGIGNGVPLAAVVTTPEIAQKLSQRLHFNTFGGNPFCSAVGREVIKIIDDEGLQENTLKQGKRFKEGLLKLQKKHSVIGDVRGKGLMVGIELVKDQKTKEPLAPQDIQNYMEKTKDLGLLIGKGGLAGNIFRFSPPMCVNQDDVDFALDVLDETFSK